MNGYIDFGHLYMNVSLHSCIRQTKCLRLHSKYIFLMCMQFMHSSFHRILHNDKKCVCIQIKWHTGESCTNRDAPVQKCIMENEIFKPFENTRKHFL